MFVGKSLCAAGTGAAARNQRTGRRWQHTHMSISVSMNMSGSHPNDLAVIVYAGAGFDKVDKADRWVPPDY